MRDDLHEGARAFNEGRYWDAHEAWETTWKAETGEFRAYVQALILLAAALHKRWHHGSLTARNFHKAQRYLATLPDVFDGVDLRALEVQVRRALVDPDVRVRLPEDVEAHETDDEATGCVS